MTGRLIFSFAAAISCLVANVAFAQLWSVDTGPTPVGVRTYSSVVFLDGGKSLAAAGANYNKIPEQEVSEIGVWNVASGAADRTLNGTIRNYRLSGRALAVSPNGKLLAAAGYGVVHDPLDNARRIEIWDVAKGEVQTTLELGRCVSVSLEFSPDGKTLASASSFPDEVVLWDVAAWKPRRRLAADAGGGSKTAYSSDGKTLAIGDKKGLALMDSTDGRFYDRLAFGEGKYEPWCLALASDGKAAAMGAIRITAPVVGGRIEGDNEFSIFLWRLEAKTGDWKLSGKEMIELKGHKEIPFSVGFSPDGRLLASGDQKRQVKIWDVTAAKELTTLTAHTGPVYDVAFSPDGKHLATVGRDSLKLWEVERILRPDKR